MIKIDQQYTKEEVTDKLEELAIIARPRTISAAEEKQKITQNVFSVRSHENPPDFFGGKQISVSARNGIPDKQIYKEVREYMKKLWNIP